MIESMNYRPTLLERVGVKAAATVGAIGLLAGVVNSADAQVIFDGRACPASEVMPGGNGANLKTTGAGNKNAVFINDLTSEERTEFIRGAKLGDYVTGDSIMPSIEPKRSKVVGKRKSIFTDKSLVNAKNPRDTSWAEKVIEGKTADSQAIQRYLVAKAIYKFPLSVKPLSGGVYPVDMVDFTPIQITKEEGGKVCTTYKTKGSKGGYVVSPAGSERHAQYGYTLFEAGVKVGADNPEIPGDERPIVKSIFGGPCGNISLFTGIVAPGTIPQAPVPDSIVPPTEAPKVVVPVVNIVNTIINNPQIKIENEVKVIVNVPVVIPTGTIPSVEVPVTLPPKIQGTIPQAPAPETAPVAEAPTTTKVKVVSAPTGVPTITTEATVPPTIAEAPSSTTPRVNVTLGTNPPTSLVNPVGDPNKVS
jgi:hypothetical protein